MIRRRAWPDCGFGQRSAAIRAMRYADSAMRDTLLGARLGYLAGMPAGLQQLGWHLEDDGLPFALGFPDAGDAELAEALENHLDQVFRC
ncbi:MAG: hypothetical protein ACJAZN_003996 [Planctomycetota bacterium]